MVSDLPRAAVHRHQLHIADALIVQRDGVDEGAVRTIIGGDEEGDGALRLFKGFEHFVGDEAADVLVQGISVDGRGHRLHEGADDKTCGADEQVDRLPVDRMPASAEKCFYRRILYFTTHRGRGASISECRGAE